MGKGWIGVDLDGTLAHYEHWVGNHHIGEPIMPMVEKVKLAIDRGFTVKVFTARVHPLLTMKDPVEYNRLWMQIVMPIEAWVYTHIGKRLEVTCVKDFQMIELWDDRCVQVSPNTGVFLGPSRLGM